MHLQGFKNEILYFLLFTFLQMGSIQNKLEGHFKNKRKHFVVSKVAEFNS